VGKNSKTEKTADQSLKVKPDKREKRDSLQERGRLEKQAYPLHQMKRDQRPEKPTLGEITVAKSPVGP